MYYRECGPEKARVYRKALDALWIVRTWTNEAFRKEILADPKGVFERQMGIEFPDDLNFQTLEETHNLIYFVLPKNPQRDQINENSVMGDWWKSSHAYWWWMTSLRFRQPAKNTVTGIVG